MTLGLPFAHGEFYTYDASTGLAGVLGPLFAVTIAAESFLRLIGEFALTWLERGWHCVL